MKKSEIKNVLVILLSNIGDVIVTFPVLDVLRGECPQAKLSVVVGPKGRALFEGNHSIHRVFIFDKHQSVPKTLDLLKKLRREQYDLVIDLRNTAFPFFMRTRRRTSPFMRNSNTMHMRLRHLQRLQSVLEFNKSDYPKVSLHIPEKDKEYVRGLIKDEIKDSQYIVICPSAADRRKRWSEEGFAELCDRLVAAFPMKVVLVGEGEGQGVVDRIVEKMKQPAVKLNGRTTLLQLAELLRLSSLAIVNDSGPMHLASYLDVPVMTLFGPTDPTTAAPWGKVNYFIKKDTLCAACRRPGLNLPHECMKAITAEEVFGVIRLTPKGFSFASHQGT